MNTKPLKSAQKAIALITLTQALNWGCATAAVDDVSSTAEPIEVETQTQKGCVEDAVTPPEAEPKPPTVQASNEICDAYTQPWRTNKFSTFIGGLIWVPFVTANKTGCGVFEIPPEGYDGGIHLVKNWHFNIKVLRNEKPFVVKLHQIHKSWQRCTSLAVDATVASYYNDSIINRQHEANITFSPSGGLNANPGVRWVIEACLEPQERSLIEFFEFKIEARPTL